jgi:endonuclease/exonuclease/phosphatase (EEP) superfamily protein YafD
MLTGITIASYFGTLHFVLDLFSHFKVHYAVLLLLLGLFFVFVKKYGWFALSMVGLSVNLAAIVPWYIAGENRETANAGTPVRIFVANVHLPNREYERLSKLVADRQPDVVGLLEVNSRWLENLASIRSNYKYRFEYPRDDLRGLALYSMLPMSDARIVRFGESATPAIAATVTSGEEDFELILVHLAWPMSAERAAIRNEQFQRMAHYVRESGKRIVIAGDLNATMWSPYYRNFETESGLINARAGYGIGATWSPIHALGIPIDHILVTPPARVGNFQVLDGIGSDHRPISADVWILPRTLDRLGRSSKDH